MDLKGATVLLTGATGGIGLAIGRALKAAGSDLIITGRRADALEQAGKALGARTILADLADPGQVDALAGQAGAVDILIANAALPGSGEVLDYTPEQIDRALNVNLRAPIMLARTLAPGMVERGRGHIVMIGSISGKTASPASGMYNATKFGLRGFAQALRLDLKPKGVGVSLIQPGFVREAGMWAATGAKPPGGSRTVSPDQVVKATLKAITHDKGEINVVPFEMRILSAIGAQFPALSGAVQLRFAAAIDPIVEAQKNLR